MITLQCQKCGEDYEVIPCREGLSKYCSRLCQNQAQANKIHIKSIAKNPNKRNRKFKQLRLVFRNQNHCSDCGCETSKRKTICFDCHIKKLDTRCTTNCKNCGAKIETYKKRTQVLCNEKCKFEYYKGVNNPNYKDGRNPINKAIRGSKEYKEWRENIMIRDNYTCRECGQVGGRLEVDHIFPFALYPDGRMHPANGKTLCKECHKKTFTYLRRYKGRPDFEREFFNYHFGNPEDVTEVL
jgi:5-methylcytosine-specific restriction endonuclease McrA